MVFKAVKLGEVIKGMHTAREPEAGIQGPVSPGPLHHLEVRRWIGSSRGGCTRNSQSEGGVEQVQWLGSKCFKKAHHLRCCWEEAWEPLPHLSPRFASYTSRSTTGLKVARSVSVKWGWWSLSQGGNICEASSTLSPRIQRAPLLSDEDNVYGVEFPFRIPFSQLISGEIF